MPAFAGMIGDGSRNDLRDWTVPVFHQPHGALVDHRSQIFVVKSHLVQDRGQQIAYIGAVFNRVEADVVGSAVGNSTLDPCASHPAGKPARIVISSCRVL